MIEKSKMILKNRMVYLVSGAIGSFVIALYETYKNPGNASLVGIWILLGIIFLIDPKRINIINFAGNSVKLQEAANELKAISKTTAALLLEVVQSGGRWGGGFNLERKEQLREEVVRSLTSSGFEDNEIAQMLAPWKKWVLFDYGSRIVFRATLNFRLGLAMRPEQKRPNVNLETVEDDFQKIHTVDSPAHALTIKELLEKNGLLDSEVIQWIEDMKFYEETGNHINFVRFKSLVEDDQ